MAAPPPQTQFDPFAAFDEPRREFHLAHWWDVVKRRRFVLVLVIVAFVAVSLVMYARTPKAYRATAIVELERHVAAPVRIEEFSEAWWDVQSFFPTQIQLLKSRGMAERVVKKLGLVSLKMAESPQPASRSQADSPFPESALPDQRTVRAAYGLLGGLSVSEIVGTRMIRVSYEAPEPVEAARVTNAFVEAYSEWGIEKRAATITKATEYLATQVQGLKNEIQKGEERLQAYSQKADLVTVDSAVSATSARFEQVQRDYLTAVSERVLKERFYQELIGKKVGLDRGGSKAAEGPAGAPLSATEAENAANSEVREARRSYEQAQLRERLLGDEIDRQKRELIKLNALAVEYAALKGEVSSRRTLLDEMQKRQAEIDVASGLRGESTVTVVEQALPPDKPFRPSLVQSLSLGFGLGLAFGLLGVIVAEYLDRTVKVPEDIDRVAHVSVLGSIPDLEEGGQRYGYYGYGRKMGSTKTRRWGPGGEAIPPELVSVHHPRIGISEAYRSLRTALLLSSAESLKTVLVTSAVAGEGKTVTVSNIAAVLAQLGRSVLLVDADMRKPRQHEVMRVSNRVGLVSFLTRQASLDEITVPTTIENLSVVPAGPLPPQPSELLGSERMREFLAAVKEKYDFVLIDSPPVLPVTDAVVLSTLVDGVLLCVGAGLAVREDLASCVERLSMVDARVLGVVLNRLHHAGGRYRHKYYYRYGSSEPVTEPEAPVET